MKGPLLISTIDQSGGWNDYCPDGGCGADEVPNGCVAVSMVALMHYWKYPDHGIGSIFGFRQYLLQSALHHDMEAPGL